MLTLRASELSYDTLITLSSLTDCVHREFETSSSKWYLFSRLKLGRDAGGRKQGLTNHGPHYRLRRLREASKSHEQERVPPLPMDNASLLLQSIQLQLLKPEISVACVALLTLLFTLYYTFLTTDEERPANLNISLPEQCKPGWKGRVLEEPAIKVNDGPIALSSHV